MRIVDLRHPLVRRLTALWGAVEPTAPRGAGMVATRLVDAWLARQAARRPLPDRAPLVVSIGNLALGGTGKTPVTVQLALDLAAGGLRGAVLTRGFGSRLRGPLVVSPGTALAGDEARMLAGRLGSTGWVVVQARHRARGLAWLLGQGPAPDVVLLEDAHQTAGIGRHLDILILDSWRLAGGAGQARVEPRTGPVAPFGPWRESARGALRAGIWLVEGGCPDAAGPAGACVAAFTRRYRLPGAPVSGNVALLSGIARPEAFESEVRRHLPASPVLAIRCADHEAYGRLRLERIDALFRECGVDSVVTTAKDLVKLEPLWNARPPLAVLEMQVRWEGPKALPELVRERLDVVRRVTPSV